MDNCHFYLEKNLFRQYNGRKGSKTSQEVIRRLAKREAVWSIETAPPEPVVAERATGAGVFRLFIAQDLLNVLARAERLR